MCFKYSVFFGFRFRYRRHLFYPPKSTTESILVLQDPSKPTTQKPIEFEAIEAEDDDVATALNEAEETDVSRVSCMLVQANLSSPVANQFYLLKDCSP